MTTLGPGTARRDGLDTLRPEILRGRHRRGDRLRQEEVAARLAVGTTPVREALRDLVGEGHAQPAPERWAALNEAFHAVLHEAGRDTRLARRICRARWRRWSRTARHATRRPASLGVGGGGPDILNRPEIARAVVSTSPIPSEFHVMPGHVSRLENEVVMGLAEDERAARTHRLAAAVLAEMRERAIVPTPRNYALWFAYRSDENPGLTRRVRTLLDEGQAFTPALLDTLHVECVAGVEVGVDAISSRSDAIQEAAQRLIERVADSRAAITTYGDALADWAQHLDNQPAPGLLQAIASMTAETVRASERNMLLEQELSASTHRIADLCQSLAEVKQEATTDALTGLANRRAFDAGIDRAMTQVRSEPRTPLSLLLIDVDHFKRFNDTHGHQMGDLVLRLVARLLAGSARDGGTVARYGGEEFAILLPGVDLHAACVLAQQIGGTLSSKRLVAKGTDNSLGQVTVSTGVAQARPGERAAALVARADKALYEAKRTGRNRVCPEQGE